MHDAAGLTIPQKILVAAAGLSEPFHESALAEAAWRADPKTFGMRTMEAKYPDVNKVRSSIAGERGMARRGWLVKVRDYTYTLGAQGRAEAERIAGGDAGRRTTGVIQPSRECEAELNRLLVSKAVLRLRGGVRDTLNLTDAMAFWAHGGAEKVEAVILAARACLVGGVVKLRSGREVREAELGEVSRVNAWLAVKFGRELARRKVVAV